MQVTETLSEGLKRAYTVVVPAASIEGKRTSKLTELGRTVRLPGFRPGKVPMPVMKQRYGSAVLAEVLEESVDEATRQVLSDRGLRPAMQPRVTPVTLDIGKAGLTQDLEFKVELELLPDITPPDFTAIALTRLKGEVSAETVDKALNELAARQRKMEDVEEQRPAEIGDWLKIDFTGSIDGVPFAGGAGVDMDVEVGGAGFIPGFTEQLAGLSAGETRTIDVTFPAEYQAAELAGKAAQFEITAKALRRAILPPIDDELGKTLGFEGLDEVRDTITRQTQREYDQLSRLRLKRDLLDALAAVSQFDTPPTMVEAEFSQIWQRVEADREAGRLDADDVAKDEAVLRTEYHAIAERRVRLGLLLAEIGRLNGITVSPEELTRAMRIEAGRYPGQEQMVIDFFRKNPQAVEGLRGPIFEDKVVDYVLELAKVEDKPATLEELQEDPPVDV
jgi:trigger factor